MQFIDENIQHEERSKCLPDLKKRPSIFYYILVLIFSLLPISPFIAIPYLMGLTRKRGIPKRLFHFVESEEVFKKITDTKILLSLAGGKVHTTSEMNPSLGRDGKDKNKNKMKVKNLYVLVIDDPDDINKFEPIINRVRMLHVYKWWKHLRSEYTYSDLNDVSFEIAGEVHNEIKKKDGIKYNLHIAHIKRLKSLKNDLLIQKVQKIWFWLGEIILTTLLFYVPWVMIVLAFNWLYGFGGSLYLFKILCFAKYVTINFYFPVFVVLLVFLYFYLRCGVIDSRS
ncbi:hypothetical protein [Pantoea coffeiphila]|uniref:Uncharacterized protein n=1 Tax=Pantoea coffeiphila TaxID=1465635 RepID=A0A2S9I878_9GAMM|nr:hypothetical protein [Pantoea coffeiphila]PRD14002.1 hypothetical protein CQW29_18530 [Pantoea coffeiphila]